MDTNGPQPTDHIAHPWRRFIRDTVEQATIIEYLEHQWTAGYEPVSVDGPHTVKERHTAPGNGGIGDLIIEVKVCTVVLMWRRDQPIPTASKHGVCPVCFRDGAQSTVTEGIGSIVTAMAYAGYYDEKNTYHLHNPNGMTTEYACSEGHRWVETRYVPCTCGWAGGTDILRIVRD